jgi:hypothetical protein
MADSVQEQIVKKIVAALAMITTVKGFDNTVQSIQRLNQSGVDLADPPIILVKEDDCNAEIAESIYPNIRRRMGIFAVAITRQDESSTSTDLRSGGEILNSLVADMEKVISNNRTWDGLAMQTDPPSYLEVEMDATVPHLARAVRFEVTYQHLRTDPYRQD